MLLQFSAMAFRPSYEQLKKAEKQIVLLTNNENLIPLVGIDNVKILSVSIGENANNNFNKMIRNYLIVESCTIDSLQSDSPTTGKTDSQLIIVSLYKAELTDNETIKLFKLMKGPAKVILCSFVPLQKWMTKPDVQVLIAANDSEQASQQMAAQLIFGGIKAQGKLSQSTGKFKKGSGLSSCEPIRLKYTVPEEVGMDGTKMTGKIDSLVNDAITQQTFPGCVVLVAKDGKVIFNKAYGYHTYFHPDTNSKPNDPINCRENIYDLFDLASLTKIIAGVPAYLKLVDEGKISLDDKFSRYFDPFKGTNKENITIRELLCHVGGLQPYIGFYRRMVNPDGTLKPEYIRSDSSGGFTNRISPLLYIRNDFSKWMYDSIAKSPLLKNSGRHKSVYSDFPFILTPPVIESIVHQPFELYLQQTYYQPLGANETGYKPIERFPLQRIVPTEQDNYFRQTLLHGYVHDESSAVLGSHSANAGLFANANDLAKILQLYLQKGKYGGKQYFRTETFDLFNSTPYISEEVYRGVGFEKPVIKNGSVAGTSYMSAHVSPESFGHTGYTGTMFWVDPKYRLVYIFLSNRVFPTRDSDRMFTTRIRANIQTVIYEAITNK